MTAGQSVMRSEGYGSCPMCVSMCLSVDYYCRATGYEKCPRYKGSKNEMAIQLK